VYIYTLYYRYIYNIYIWLSELSVFFSFRSGSTALIFRKRSLMPGFWTFPAERTRHQWCRAFKTSATRVWRMHPSQTGDEREDQGTGPSPTRQSKKWTTLWIVVPDVSWCLHIRLPPYPRLGCWASLWNCTPYCGLKHWTENLPEALSFCWRIKGLKDMLHVRLVTQNQ
jgi:hypothetical protein